MEKLDPLFLLIIGVPHCTCNVNENDSITEKINEGIKYVHIKSFQKDALSFSNLFF